MQDATYWMAELAEAVRKGQLEYVVSEDPPRVARLEEIKGKMNHSAPVFFFDRLGAKDETESDLYDFREEQSTRLIENGLFRLPYPQCFFVYLTPPLEKSDIKPLKGNKGLYVIYCEQVSSKAIKLIVVQTAVNSLTDKLMMSWAASNFVVQLDQEHPFGKIIGRWAEGPDPTEFEEGRLNMSIIAVKQCVAIIHKVANEPRTPLQLGNRAKEVNLGRARAQLPPLGQIVKFDILDYGGAAWDDHAQGTEKRPHDRRGHCRRYKSGKTVFISAQKIKGGRDVGATYIPKLQ